MQRCRVILIGTPLLGSDAGASSRAFPGSRTSTIALTFVMSQFSTSTMWEDPHHQRHEYAAPTRALARLSLHAISRG